MIYWIAYVITKFVGFIFFPRKVVGRENIPKGKSFIIASNHISYLDPQVIGLCFWRRLSYMAKDSLFKNKFFAFVLFQVGAFPVKRDTSDFYAIREAFRRLKGGTPLLVFPEGTRGVKEREKKPHEGIAFLAVKSKSSILPAFVKGTDEVLPSGAKFFKRHPVTVIFGKPLYFNEGQSYPEIAKTIVDKIYALSLST